ncbi:hypothetical protein [Actinoplanes teichomyceticus]|uniref:hypothetical protein n=1 Tax=Actinoplanes teichomyceticus TaxID=1867 RepID=UPI000F09E765|nr:hypothetical protein [Actinoplanes teichomyceticus]GIF13022.1 hypothetical protein Ate01nite_30540 [Actinoplanes teichomyceticus]
MRLAMIAIRTGAAPTLVASREILVDALWAATLPEDDVEHITVRIRPDHIAVGIWMKAVSGTDPATTADALVTRAVDMSPLLRNGSTTAARNIRIPHLPREGHSL